MKSDTLSDPLAGIPPVSMDDQFTVARLAVAKVLQLNGISFPFKVDEIPEEVMDQIDTVLHALGIHVWEAWPKEPTAQDKKRTR